MKIYIIFIFLLTGAYIASVCYRKYAFNNLSVKRSISRDKLFPGEEFKINLQIENGKLIPVPFLNIQEIMPSQVKKKNLRYNETMGNTVSYSDIYSVGGRERVKRSYPAEINKRGVYFLRNLNVTIVDFFGMDKEEKQIEDFKEIVVYPKLKDFSHINVTSNSILGENIIKRWIFTDPIFIKGIRGYTGSERMKDIHWNSSLRMGNLMVKEYDYSSDKEAVLIINVQYNRPFWNSINEERVNKSCEIAASLSQSFLDKGIPVGLWSNAHIISHYGDLMDKVPNSLNNMVDILEFCGRVDSTPREDFYDYFKRNLGLLTGNTVCVIIAGYLSRDVQELIEASARQGNIIKIIDISRKNDLDEIAGTEKLNVREVL